MVERLIGFRADGFLHLHLQNQVRSTLEVQTKLDAIGEIRLQGRIGLRHIGKSNQADNTGQHDTCDENCLPLKIRIHGLVD